MSKTTWSITYGLDEVVFCYEGKFITSAIIENTILDDIQRKHDILIYTQNMKDGSKREFTIFPNGKINRRNY